MMYRQKHESRMWRHSKKHAMPKPYKRVKQGLRRLQLWRCPKAFISVIQMTRRANEQQKQKKSEQPISEPYKRVKRTSSAAHPLRHKMRNLATLGFPAPDADHQKHISSFGEALNMARLYIATWLQAVCEGNKEQHKPAHPKQGFISENEETSLPSSKMEPRRGLETVWNTLWPWCEPRSKQRRIKGIKGREKSSCFVLPRRPPTQSLAIPCEPIVFPHRQPTVLS